MTGTMILAVRRPDPGRAVVVPAVVVPERVTVFIDALAGEHRRAERGMHLPGPADGGWFRRIGTRPFLLAWPFLGAWPGVPAGGVPRRRGRPRRGGLPRGRRTRARERRRGGRRARGLLRLRRRRG